LFASQRFQLGKLNFGIRRAAYILPTPNFIPPKFSSMPVRPGHLRLTRRRNSRAPVSQLSPGWY